MSGHSKWNNIKNKKAKTDAARGQVFTKIGKEIAIAVREGGPDPDGNSKLRELIAKAKAANVPNDNIERAIKKAAGADAVVYEEIVYEGYGPCGVAVIVKTATDSRNRTASNMRHYFDKYGGNLGQNGCVSFMFEEKGVIMILREDNIDEDKLMEDALESGAADFSADEEGFEITTEPDDVYAVRDALVALGYEIESADVSKIPTNYITLTTEDDIKNMNKLLEMLDDDDDVSEVYHNWQNDDEDEE